MNNEVLQERLIEKSEQLGISYCALEDDVYPVELRKIKDAPPVLFYKGAIEIANAYKCVAIIGSRESSDNGVKLSYNAGKIMADNRIIVVNRLAAGCDTVALEGAIKNGGKCIALLPAGLDNVQPKANRLLAQAIVDNGGCLISEYPIGTPLKKYNYVKRDRLQSGISQGVVIVEAKKKSGTMHTAEFAVKQYKRLACYYDKIVGGASGNKYLQDSGKAEVIKDNDGLKQFISRISAYSDKYEQLSLF